MKTNLNLLPSQFGRDQIIRGSLVLWSCIGLIACSALIAAGYRQHARLTAARSELADSEVRCNPVRATLKENNSIGGRIAELHGRQTLLAHLNRGQHPLQLIGLVSRSAQIVGGNLNVASLSYQITETVVQPESVKQDSTGDTPAAVTESIRLTLDGFAANALAVWKFILALRESGYFTTVELRSSVRSELATGRARSFRVDCTL